MKRKNTERAAKRRAEAFGEQAELCRLLPCVACEATMYPGMPPSAWRSYGSRAALLPVAAWMRRCDPHHVPTRGAGGVDKDTVPLCREHHREWHDIGEKSFDAKHGVNLRAVAKAIHDELTAQNVAQGMEQRDDG
jgi:hypothetical protein